MSENSLESWFKIVLYPHEAFSQILVLLYSKIYHWARLFMAKLCWAINFIIIWPNCTSRLWYYGRFTRGLKQGRRRFFGIKMLIVKNINYRRQSNNVTIGCQEAPKTYLNSACLFREFSSVLDISTTESECENMIMSVPHPIAMLKEWGKHRIGCATSEVWLLSSFDVCCLLTHVQFYFALFSSWFKPYCVFFGQPFHFLNSHYPFWTKVETFLEWQTFF